MSLDIANRLARFLASAPQNIHPVQVLQFSHSAMTTYTLWREPYTGSVTINGVATAVLPLNMEIKLAGSANNLDQRYDIRVDTVDINDLFRAAIDGVPLTSLERIKVAYFEFLSDDLTTPLVTATLQAESVTWQKGAALITAVAPRLSINRTGETYSVRDVPMLRGFL